MREAAERIRDILEAIEQIVHGLAVLEQNLVGYPIGKVIHPNRP